MVEPQHAVVVPEEPGVVVRAATLGVVPVRADLAAVYGCGG